MISKRGSSVRIGLPYLSRSHSERSFHSLIPRHPRIQESSITFFVLSQKSGSSYAEKSSCIKLKNISSNPSCFFCIFSRSFPKYPSIFTAHTTPASCSSRTYSFVSYFVSYDSPNSIFPICIWKSITGYAGFSISVFFSTAAQTGSNFSNSIQNHPF